MDNSKFDSKDKQVPLSGKKMAKPSSLCLSNDQREETDSGASTPIEDYMTPPTESAPFFPMFEESVEKYNSSFDVNIQHILSVTGLLASSDTVNESAVTVTSTNLDVSGQRNLPEPMVKDAAGNTFCGGTDSRKSQNVDSNSVISTGLATELGKSFDRCDDTSMTLESKFSKKCENVKKTTFAATALSRQTTWAKDTSRLHSIPVSEKNVEKPWVALGEETAMLASSWCSSESDSALELADVREKMESRRREIESEKRSIEVEWKKHKQSLDANLMSPVMSTNSPNPLVTQMGPPEILMTKKDDYDAGDAHEVRQVTSVIIKGTSPDEFSVSCTSRSEGDNWTSMPSNEVKRSNVGEYGASLDRLNSSLTELQGEIMRLSLRQDKIKNLVVSSAEHDQSSKLSSPASSSSHAVGHETSNSLIASREQFYLFPGKTSNEGDHRITESSSVGSSGTVDFSSNQASSSDQIHSMQPNLHQNFMPYPGYPIGYPYHEKPSYSLNQQQYAASFGQYPHYYIQPQHELLSGRFYLPPAVSPYPPSMYGHESQMFYRASSGYSTGQWPSSFSMPQHHQYATPNQDHQTIPADLFRNSPRITNNNAQQQKQHLSQKPPPRDSSQDRSPLHYESKMEPNLSGFLSSSKESKGTPAVQSNGESGISSVASVVSTVPTTAALINEALVATAVVKTPLPASEAFYMTFSDSRPVRRVKPQLRLSGGDEVGKKRKMAEKVDQIEAVTVGDESTLTTNEKLLDYVVQDASSYCDTSVIAAVEATAAASTSFVIDDTKASNMEEGTASSCSSSSSADSTSSQELVKRRKRIEELQLKRRQELEAKRKRIEEEQRVRTEAERAKKEEANQKRVDDRTRRKAIFANYLQRKTEEDGGTTTDEDKKSANVPPSVTRRSALRVGGKHSRTSSQPPPLCSSDDMATVRFAENISTQLFRSKDDQLVGEQLTSNQEFNTIGNANSSRATPERLVRFLSAGNELYGDLNNPVVDNYSGPKLFVKPSQKSNKTIIINAIKDCCLAGAVNQDTKNKVLEELTRSDSKHFVILFRDGGQQYKGLYTYNPDQDEVFRLHGVGPKQLTDKMMEKFLKYNSGTKTFTEVTSTKHLSATIDAVILLNSLWQKKPVAPTTPVKRH